MRSSDASARASRDTSARACRQHRSGDPIAARVLAAIERSVCDLKHLLSELALADGDTIEPTETEARGDLDAAAMHFERLVCDAGAEFARDVERVVVCGLRQHDGKFFAADARHPIDAAAQ